MKYLTFQISFKLGWFSFLHHISLAWFSCCCASRNIYYISTFPTFLFYHESYVSRLISCNLRDDCSCQSQLSKHL